MLKVRFQQGEGATYMQSHVLSQKHKWIDTTKWLEVTDNFRSLR